MANEELQRELDELLQNVDTEPRAPRESLKLPKVSKPIAKSLTAVVLGLLPVAAGATAATELGSQMIEYFSNAEYADLMAQYAYLPVILGSAIVLAGLAGAFYNVVTGNTSNQGNQN